MRANYVQQPVTLWPADGPDETLIFGTLFYRLADPFAVELVVPRGRGRKVETILFGRALLIDGLEAPTGQGLVRIEPHIVDSGFITLTLPLGGRPQQVSAQRSVLEAFADATFRLVPLGRERDLIDFDGWLAEVTS